MVGNKNFWAVSASSDSIAWYAGDGTLIRVTPSYKYWYQVGGDDNEFLFYTSIFTPKGSLGQTCFVTDEWGSIYKTNDFVRIGMKSITTNPVVGLLMVYTFGMSMRG